MHSRRPLGFALALVSAASFGLSGIFASALLDGGWSAGAVTTVRIAGGALVLLPPTLWLLRGRWDAALRSWREVLVLGLLAVALCQLAFFSAVAFIDPSLALLIEFLGPVLLVLLGWVVTRTAPAWLTLAGAGVALVGLGLISGIGGDALHPVGVLLALLAAVGNAGYWVAASKADSELHPIALAGLGLIVGAIVLGAASATGLLPFVMSAEPVRLAGETVPAWLVVLLLIAIATATAYVVGILGARRLGATLASFAGYSEPMFGILWTAVLLLVLPSPVQWLGAIAIVAGVVLVKLGQVDRPTATMPTAVVEGIPNP